MSGKESDGYDTDELIAAARSTGTLKKVPTAAGAAGGRGGSAGAGRKQQRREDSDDEVFEAEFTLFDPRPSDYHGVKVQLKPFLSLGPAGEDFDLEGLAEVVSEQASHGTMIKGEDGDEQPLGLATIVSLHLHRGKKWAQQIRAMVNSRAPPDARKTFLDALDDQSKALGLFINERLINVPPQVIPDLHKCLVEDVAWAQENESTTELRKACSYAHVVLVARLYHARDSEERVSKKVAKRLRRGPAASAAAAATAGAAAAGDDPDRELDGSRLLHWRWENETFESAATCQFRFERPPEFGTHIAQVFSVSLIPWPRLRELMLSLPREFSW